MRTSIAIVVTLVSCFILTGCEETKRAFGKTKEAPDEFAVYKRAPLSLPPDFDLRPPVPGAQRPQTLNPRNRARLALGIPAEKSRVAGKFGSTENANLSKGERALLVLTGANKANPEIRKIVEAKSLDLFETNKAFTDKILFWQGKDSFGVAVDPNKELKRIREAQALGKPINDHDIPIITRKKKAIFEGIFD